MPERTICVTGASGFIAAHVVRLLLERGYRVRGTVRSLSTAGKYDYLTGLPGAAARLTLHEANLTDAGSYDAAILGCDGVMHIASPYLIATTDPQRELIDPAVNGTLNVLRSAAKAEVDRVVLTSSMAAISDEPTDHVFTEADWNERSTARRNPYYASKVQAERAAWAFVEQNAPGFDLIAINPYMTHGVSLGPSLNATNAVLRDILTGVYPGILALNWGFVDVADAALAHVLAMETPGANGRYLCAGAPLTMGDVVEILQSSGYDWPNLPSRDLTGALSTALLKLYSYTQNAGTGSYLRTHLGRTMRYDNGRIQADLNLQFTPPKQSIPAAVADMVRWGHLTPPA